MTETSSHFLRVGHVCEFEALNETRQQSDSGRDHNLKLMKSLFEVFDVIVAVNEAWITRIIHIRVVLEGSKSGVVFLHQFVEITRCDAIKQSNALQELLTFQHPTYVVKTGEVALAHLIQPAPFQRPVFGWKLASEVIEVEKLKLDMSQIFDLRMKRSAYLQSIGPKLSADQLAVSSLARAIGSLHHANGFLHLRNGECRSADCGEASNQSLKLVDPRLPNRKYEYREQRSDRGATASRFHIRPHKNRPPRIARGVFA